MSTHTRFTLHDNGTVRLLPRAEGLRLRAERGTFLVTQEGDPEDHVLRDRGEVRTGRRGLVVVWALSDGAFEVDDEPLRAA
jgi:hypothetical protein